MFWTLIGGQQKDLSSMENRSQVFNP